METEDRTIVCLCGSFQFPWAFHAVERDETLLGNIVLKPFKQDRLMGELTAEHFRRIDMADEILVLNIGGYIGEHTAQEIKYAKAKGKAIRFYEPEPKAFLASEKEKQR